MTVPPGCGKRIKIGPRIVHSSNEEKVRKDGLTFKRWARMPNRVFHFVDVLSKSTLPRFEKQLMPDLYIADLLSSHS